MNRFLARVSAIRDAEREAQVRAISLDTEERVYLSPKQVAEIRRLLKTDMSKSAIARAVGCSPFSVRQYAKEGA